MGIITTGSHPKALWTGVKIWWGKVYKEHPAEWPDLVDVLPSEQAYEEMVQDVGFELAPIKSQGGSIYYSADQQGFVTKITHITFALGYVVTLEEKINNLYEAVSMRRASANAFSMRQTKENVVAALFNNAFSSTLQKGADGKALCASDHPRVTGGTYSNVPSVISDLSESALEDACVDIMGFANDRGMPVSVMPRSLHVSRFRFFNATRLLKSINQSGTANNDINAIRATNSIPDGVKMNHYFTGANPWYLRTNVPARNGGLVMFQRLPIQFDQDNDFDTKNLKAAAIEMYSVGWGDARTIYGVNAP